MAKKYLLVGNSREILGECETLKKARDLVDAIRKFANLFKESKQVYIYTIDESLTETYEIQPSN